MIKIVTDSTGSFSEEYLKEKDITLVSMYACIEGKYHKEGSRENLKELLVPVKNHLDTVTTSQPSPADFQDAFKSVIDNKDDVICIVTSSKVSGTYSCAELSRSFFDEEDQKKIFVIDSRVTASGIALLVDRALDHIKKGLTTEETVDLIKSDVERISSIITLDKLDSIVRSGRISKLAGKIAGFLNMRPILRFEKDGSIGIASKAKGKNSQFKSFLKEMEGEFSYIYYTASEKSSIREEMIKHIKELKERNKSLVVKEVPPSAVILGIGGDTSFAVFTL